MASLALALEASRHILTVQYPGLSSHPQRYVTIKQHREGLGGGAYLWESQEAAEAAYNPEWVAYMTEKYNQPPTVEFYEMPITMDREYDTVYDEGAVADAAE